MRLRRSLLVILALSLLIGVCSCDRNKKKEKEDDDDDDEKKVRGDRGGGDEKTCLPYLKKALKEQKKAIKEMLEDQTKTLKELIKKMNNGQGESNYKCGGHNSTGSKGPCAHVLSWKGFNSTEKVDKDKSKDLNATAEDPQYQWFGRLPILPKNKGCSYQLSTPDQTVSHAVEQQDQWKSLLQNNDSSTVLRLPPLVLCEKLGGQVVVLYLSRRGNMVTLHGGYHPATETNVTWKSVELTLSLNATLLNGSTISKSKTGVIALKHFSNDTNGYPQLMWFMIRGEKMSSLNANRPPALSASFSKAPNPWYVYGLAPILPDERGTYPPIQWSQLNGSVCWTQTWRGMASGERNDSKLLLPPIALPKAWNCSVAIFYLLRNASDLNLYAKFHPFMPWQTPPAQLTLTLNITVAQTNVGNATLLLQMNKSITINHAQAYKGALINTFASLQWSDFSGAVPNATIAITSATSGQKDQKTRHH